jgi:hypothetical protein
MKKKSIEKNFTKAGIPELAKEQLEALPKAVSDVYKFLQEKEDVPFPKKYYAAQKTLISLEIRELKKSNPELGLASVVGLMIQKLPDFIPGNCGIDKVYH